MTATGRCANCGHAAHKKACRAKGPSGCIPLETPGGGVGFACGARPSCPCSWQVCKCGVLVAVASLAGEDVDAAVERGSANDPAGTLAVRKLPDGSLSCREIGAADELRDGEWRGREHVEWPDHGPIAAQFAPGQS